jgi:hypothetical protein
LSRTRKGKNSQTHCPIRKQQVKQASQQRLINDAQKRKFVAVLPNPTPENDDEKYLHAENLKSRQAQIHIYDERLGID